MAVAEGAGCAGNWAARDVLVRDVLPSDKLKFFRVEGIGAVRDRPTESAAPQLAQESP